MLRLCILKIVDWLTLWRGHPLNSLICQLSNELVLKGWAYQSILLSKYHTILAFQNIHNIFLKLFYIFFLKMKINYFYDKIRIKVIIIFLTIFYRSEPAH